MSEEKNEKEEPLTSNKMFQAIHAQALAQKAKRETDVNRLKEGAAIALKRNIERGK